ncbi:DUF3159 domain-containing protein [Schaalia sp. 19OD2882]|uniref:DUF3159 domain-containing protein n=1 Tax=Schaalia sp. 19OD2882 TaxID=2794089 RepID=UPI001C1ED981|nr:DUF3159 domain-containing protein [Schaalia sp. 19OD2882]QWW20435.1 DUF3159 domain-containing protein [Schaalia sp. 19OD2882]
MNPQNEDTSVGGPASSNGGGSPIVRQLGDKTFSWSAVIGGPREVAESVLPAVVFLGVFVPTRNLLWALVAACVLAIVFTVVRLVLRESLLQAISGLMGVALSVALAAWTGRGEDYFLWGLVSAGLFATVLGLSALVRRPLVGVVLEMVWGLAPSWWRDPQCRELRRRAHLVTWAWCAMFALRLAVQYPLWSAGMVAELGVAKMVLGLPLFAVLAWLTWLLLHRFAPSRTGQGARSESE